MTTPDGRVTLSRVYFTGPVPLHGRLVKEIKSHDPMPDPQGGLSSGWALHLHPNVACVVVTADEGVALVPLHAVRSMQAAWDEPDDEAQQPTPARRGKARTKRLQFVSE